MTGKLFIKSLTPILVVDRIEPCLPFWVERLGFEQIMGVPEGDHIGFTILRRDGVEVMYQTRTSVRDDLPALADLASSIVLYVTVEDLEAIISRADPADIVVARRRTFYGADEIFLREPIGGHVVGFAQMSEAEA
jgi:uncharacterized glyoxalase superfamily protein PhnB